MPKYNGKFQKNQSKNKDRIFLTVGIFATVGVLSILGIAVYKMGELSAMEVQKAALETEIIQQQTEQEATQSAKAIPVTELPSTEPTEATAAPVETTVVYVEETKPTSEPAAPTEQTGTVLRSAGELRIRSGAGTNYSEIGRLKGGDPVTIYEQKTVNGMTWGNIGDGWVSMNYIVFGEDTSLAPTIPPQSTYVSSEQNVLNKRELCDGYWVSGDGRFEMTLASSGDTVEIYITYRIFSSNPVEKEWKVTGTFDSNDNIQYSGCVRTDSIYGSDNPVYTDGKGTITIYQSQLEWYDYKEHFGSPTVYYRAGAHTTLPANSGTGNNSGQSSSSSSSSGGLSSLIKYPKRFANKDLQPYMDSIAKTELGYRYGDGYSITSCGMSSYDPSNGQYTASIRGTWNKKTFCVTAILQDSNGVLTLAKVKEVYVR